MDSKTVAAAQKSQAPPLSFEGTLALKEEPDQALPAAIKSSLSTPKIHISNITNRSEIENRLAPVGEIGSTWSIKLPDGASFGLPGQTGERLDRAAVALPEGLSTASYRPDWSGISYQPRAAQPFTHSNIQTISGRTLEQYYGIYDNPDARQVYYPQAYPWRCTGRIFTYTNW